MAVKFTTKLSAVLLCGAILAGSLTGCTTEFDEEAKFAYFNTKVVAHGNEYDMENLKLLYNDEEDARICEKEQHDTETQTVYGYRIGWGITMEGQYGYGYSYGQMDQVVTIYKYTDIDKKEVVATDKNMKGYNQTSLFEQLGTEFCQNADYKIDSEAALNAARENLGIGLVKSRK